MKSSTDARQHLWRGRHLTCRAEMHDLPLVSARALLVFPDWSDAGRPRSLLMFAHYVVGLADATETVRTETDDAAPLLDAAVDSGAAAWWVLKRVTHQDWSIPEIVSAYEDARPSGADGWQDTTAPLSAWYRGMLMHADGVLQTAATAMANEDSVVSRNLIFVIGLAEEGAGWLNGHGMCASDWS